MKVDFDPNSGSLSFASALPLGLTRVQINGKSILEATKEEALRWCELRRKEATVVALWCSLLPDHPKKTLGEQLTSEIVAQLTKAEAA